MKFAWFYILAVYIAFVIIWATQGPNEALEFNFWWGVGAFIGALPYYVQYVISNPKPKGTVIYEYDPTGIYTYKHQNPVFNYVDEVTLI